MQKDIWEKEYQTEKNIPSTRTMKPSKAVQWFVESYVKSGKLTEGVVLDMGSGKGRNAIFLAKNGFKVQGVEMIEIAAKEAQKAAKEEQVSERCVFLNLSVGEKLPFADQSFDLIVDMMTMHLLSKEERALYCQEVVRLLKKGSYFLFYTIWAESPAAVALFTSNPGPEENSYIIPQTGMVEKGFTKQELESMFSPLQFVHLEEKDEFTPAFGDVYERVYYLGLMQK